jgi:WD40 repeat protein
LRGWEWRYLWRQCQGGERFILGEHTNGAAAVGLLADGKRVFSAGKDKFVRLWDLESRRQIGLLPHAEGVVGAAASSDGRWLATASMRGSESQPVLLWNLATQKAATLATNFWLRAGSIAFSPDSKWLAFVSQLDGLRLWDVNAYSEVTNLPAAYLATGPLGLAFSPDSRTLAYNENNSGAILLWDIVSRSVTNRLTGHQSYVTALTFSPDGKSLASGSQDRTARLWNLADRRELWFTNHTSGVGSLAFSPDGRTLAMSGAGQVIRLMDVQTGSQTAELRGHLKGVSSLAFTTNGQSLLSASDDGTIRVWDPADMAKENSAHLFAQNSIGTDWLTYGHALCLSPDGRHLLTVYTNQEFSVWDTLRLSEGERHPLPFTNTLMAAVAPGGKLAAFASRAGEVMLWNVDTSQARFFAQPGTNRIHRLIFSPDGRYLAFADNAKPLSQKFAGNESSTIRVWDVGAQKETHVFSTDGEFPISLQFSTDAKAFMAGFWKGGVKLWQLDGSGEATVFPGHSQQAGGTALLPGGKTLISVGGDIRFGEVPSRQQIGKINPRTGVRRVALTPDGRRFATGGSDGSISIWDVASHEEVATLEGHKETVMQLAFTPDGNHLVSVSKDRLQIWRAPSWEEIEAPEKRGTK